MKTYSIVAIGTSWGGLSAMTRLLGGLPQNFPIPIVIVQHRSKDSDELLPRLLQDSTDLQVCEIEDKDVLEPGKVHVAPADYHVMLDCGYVSLTIEEPVRFSRGPGAGTGSEDRRSRDHAVGSDSCGSVGRGTAPR